ncbi:MAG: beta-N-acetylhexosaminidase [Bacteroidales bacterium]
MTKKTLFLLFSFLLCILQSKSQISILPEPSKIVEREGCFVFNTKTKLYVEEEVYLDAISDLVNYLRNSAMIDLTYTTKRQKSNSVEFILNDKLPDEGYYLNVSPKKIIIESAGRAGFFYGVQSLLQILPSEIFSEKFSEVTWRVPCVEIDDQPQFSYRGLMLDVSRFFVPKKEIIHLLDYMSIHKINKFHWHLIDDNGWRIEIKKYPLLTSIGAYRAGREAMFPLRTNQQYGEPTPVGGYYTQEDVREIVAYAAKRNIEVIPEIEMPAHTNSSLAAYPHLACPVVNSFLATIPGGGGRNAAAVYCAGNDSVFTFLEDVIDEVATLFPSDYVHIGGDEASKEYWEKCPLCQQRMKDNNIPNEEELQSYFIKRMDKYLKSKGKKLIGWDELVDSELPEEATIFGWRGMAKSALKAAQKGHNVVLTPAQKLYLIRYQGPQWFEPFTYFGNNTLKDVYEYDMTMSGFTPDLKDRVLGYQASMWTEFISSTQHLEYMLFPRLAALADISWASKPRNWANFLTRIDRMCRVYDYKNISYAHSMFNLFHDVQTVGLKSSVRLSCIRPDVNILYTTDGTIPTSASNEYSNEPIEIPQGAIFQARTFKDGVAVGDILKLTPVRNLATGAMIQSQVTDISKLVNGVLGSEKFTDGEYVDVYNKNISFSISLDSLTQISEIYLSTVLNGGMGAHYPAEVSVYISNDGVNFTSLSKISFPESLRFVDCVKKDRLVLKEGGDPVEARIIKFEIQTPGTIPDGMPREGQPSRMAFDEVFIQSYSITGK